VNAAVPVVTATIMVRFRRIIQKKATSLENHGLLLTMFFTLSKTYTMPNEG
jgi:hypothetical protein